jgi:hypothetical protein
MLDQSSLIQLFVLFLVSFGLYKQMKNKKMEKQHSNGTMLQPSHFFHYHYTRVLYCNFLETHFSVMVEKVMGNIEQVQIYI